MYCKDCAPIEASRKRMEYDRERRRERPVKRTFRQHMRDMVYDANPLDVFDQIVRECI
jgi:hypothetical protein